MSINFRQYYDAGIKVTPLYKKDDNQLPVVKFSDFYDAEKQPTNFIPEGIDTWKQDNIALVCGSPSNVVCVDIDHATEAQIAAVINILGDTPCKKFGSKGISLFYKFSGEENHSFCSKDENKKTIVHAEILSTGRLTTLPPSKHRSKEGVEYVWQGVPLIGANLPTIAQTDYIKRINSVFYIVEKPVYIPTSSYHFEKTQELSDAENLLHSYISPDCDRLEWLSIGSSLRYCFGDMAFSTFNDWSAKSTKYNKGEISSVWRSLHGSYDYGVLVNAAKKGGFVPSYETYNKKNVVNLKVDDWDKKKLERIAVTIKESQELPDFYNNAPKHIKEICDWILETSFYPQPIITLGGTMAFLSFLMGTNAELIGLKPNLYVVCLAGTGTGKDHIVNCLRGMANHSKLDDKVSEAWTSDTAIVKRLKKNAGKTLYLTDEMYSVMKSISSGNSNSREAAAATTLLKAYSGVQVSTVDYADDKEKPTIVMKEPFISIAGFSTPEPFFDAIGSKEAFNGFIGRLAVFEGSFLLPEPNEKADKNAWKNPPKHIQASLTQIQNNVDRLKLGENEVTSTKRIKYGEGVLEAVQQMEKDIRNKRNIYKLEGNPMDNVIARIGELTKKYAIIASKGDTIELEHLLWAQSLAEYNLGIICAASNEFTDSKFNSKVNKLLNWITKQGGLVDKTTLNNNCKMFDNRKERDDVIQELIDCEKIEVVSLEGKIKKTGYRVK
jgi:hypothetical protein